MSRWLAQANPHHPFINGHPRVSRQLISSDSLSKIPRLLSLATWEMPIIPCHLLICYLTPDHASPQPARGVLLLGQLSQSLALLTKDTKHASCFDFHQSDVNCAHDSCEKSNLPASGFHFSPLLIDFTIPSEQ